MPKLSRWAIRAALFWLVVGWAIGAWLMMTRAWGWSAQAWFYIDHHIAMVLFGWTLQLVIAVAYWILPTFGGRQNRGREPAAWASVVAVNLGVVAIVAGAAMATAVFSWLVATLCFGWHAWPRVKEFGPA